jgi:Zn-dependent protease
VSAPWPPPPPQPGKRWRADPRWLTVIVLGIIAVVVLDRQGKIHLSRFELLYFAAVIPSVILHEVSHGWVALACGDDTAKRAHRITLNPLAHVSVWGTLVVPALLILAGLPPLGWAKPVPVNLGKLRHPRNQAVLVSLSGPAVNIVLAVVFGLVFGHFVSAFTQFSIVNFGIQSGIGQPLGAQYVFALGFVNVILAVFNLIPLPPLDGSAVLERLIPNSWLPGYLSLRPYTIFLPLLVLMVKPQLYVDLYQPFLNLWAHLL